MEEFFDKLQSSPRRSDASQTGEGNHSIDTSDTKQNQVGEKEAKGNAHYFQKYQIRNGVRETEQQILRVIKKTIKSLAILPGANHPSLPLHSFD